MPLPEFKLMDTPIKTARNAIRTAYCSFYCDKLKSGFYSVKLAYWNGTEMSDSDVPAELFYLLHGLAHHTKSHPRRIREHARADSKPANDGTTTTRFYFAI